MRRKPKPRWQRRKEARPAEIVTAALDVFVERGFAATRLEEVARRAGVTKGTVYLYFANKEALFKAVVRENIVSTIALGEQLVAEYRGSPRDLVAQLLRRWWELIGETRLSGIPKLVMAESTNFPELARFYNEEVVHRGRRLFAEVLRRGIAAGEFRPVDMDAAVVLAFSPLVHAVIMKHSIHKCVNERFNAQRYVDTHVDFFLRAIAQQPLQDAAHA